ncbi:MAG TPA: 4Fe-4S dicluster domain-containing protein [Anaerolineae bacterium]|nr:4Fe-4S dicluster domain-containing protein [Anaerolineae bacterium]
MRDAAPPTKLLFEILALLFSEREAQLVSQLPVKPFTAKKAAQLWQMSEVEARKALDELASRAILLDMDQDGETIYILPPPMAGFFEFSMMRIRADIDQHTLGELFYQYMNVEDEFIRALFANGETQLGRAFVNEPALSADNALHVLDYERASEVIQTATHLGIGVCYCRHKMEHVGHDCGAPKNICMTFNGTADALTRHGYARAVDKAEGLDLLQEAYAYNLVQFGENVREGVNFICNCCGCCCEALIAQRKFGVMQPIHTTNFSPHVQDDLCNGCGKCVNICPVEAMTLVSANDPHKPNKRLAKLDVTMCLGCGVCTRVCPTKGLWLEVRPERVITPVNSTHRVVAMAIERGDLQDLIFDNQVLFSHRAMAAILGVILKLPPIKQAMASRQMKSRYLEALIARVNI